MILLSSVCLVLVSVQIVRDQKKDVWFDVAYKAY